MQKVLLTPAVFLALLMCAAQAKNDPHDHGAPASGSQMMQAGGSNAGANGNAGRHNGRSGKPGGQSNGGNNRSGGKPGNNWSGSYRPGGSAGWHGNNWRNDRAYWNRYHRSWTATRRHRWTGPYVRPAGWYYRRWSLGAFLPALFFAQQYWISNYALFALDPPPPGTVWVRYGNDALLVDRATGEIIQIVHGIFY